MRRENLAKKPIFIPFSAVEREGMERSGFPIYLFLLNMLIYCGGYWKVSGSCLDSERKALTTFRKALNDTSNILSSWDDEASDCCKWRGITCHNITGYVLKLDLHTYNNSYLDNGGLIDPALSLSGRIDPAVVELKHLQLLDLSYNAFNGIPIPRLLGSMKELRHLNLSKAGFSGRIPHQLGNLSKLISMYLSSYPYSLSAKNVWWLTNLTSLKYLHMSSVNLSRASHDWVHVMNKCPSLVELRLVDCGLSYISPTLASVNFTSLRVLHLSSNHFNFRIPEWIGNISSLVSLNLSKAGFSGSIPAALGGLSSLEVLLLRGNQLDGIIPTTLGQLSNLSWLDLSYNSFIGNVSETHFENLKNLFYLDLSFNSLAFNLHPHWVPPFQLSTISLGSCHLGPRFPPWLQKQNGVRELDLSNTAISDIIPTWFWDLTPQLSSLNLSNNEISGQLPNSLTMDPLIPLDIDLSSNHFSGPIPCILNGSAVVLDLSKNQFSGPIPPNFTSIMNDLQVFSARGNQISGIIPSSIGKMKALVVLDLSQNNISGTIPLRLGDCVNLTALDLSKNHLSERIPTSLGLLHQLQTMHLSNNSLSGEVPSTLKNCTLLETLDLGHNNFSGQIPAWIGKSFLALRILNLRSNMFTGNIPPQLLNITSLQVLDLAQNCLSGSIPQSLQNLTTMKNEQKMDHFILNGTGSYYKENLLMFVKGLMREYSKTISLVTCIDLSSNNLSGEIPEQLTSLLELRFLNLSGNHLTGKIPDKIGKLALLESLDFSKNQLSGTIPLSMSNLTFLSYLNLSNNNLLGKIPLGNQLQTFQDPSIYMGNNDLCGPPLPDKCNIDEKNDGMHEIIWFYSALAPGFAVGFSAFSGILVFKKSWRIAYYRFFDEMKDTLFYNCCFTRC